MLSSDQFQKIPVPFAENGSKNTVPTLSQIGISPGAASFNDGFPPATMTPLAAGGIPPSGLDVNGVLHALSQAARIVHAGQPMVFDLAFANAAGGYPKGALLWTGQAVGQYWLSQIESNLSVPGTPGAAWLGVVFGGGGATVTSFNSRTGAVGLIGSDVLTALGFEPVEQGGGINQLTNKVHIGWDGNGLLRATVDATDLGGIVFHTDLASFVPYSALTAAYGYSGYKVIPSPAGVAPTIIQWARGTTGNGNGDPVLFPIAFPNEVYSVVICEGNASGWGSAPPNPTIFGYNPANNASFSLYCAQITNAGRVSQGGIAYNYIAIGS